MLEGLRVEKSIRRRRQGEEVIGPRLLCGARVRSVWAVVELETELEP